MRARLREGAQGPVWSLGDHRVAGGDLRLPAEVASKVQISCIGVAQYAEGIYSCDAQAFQGAQGCTARPGQQKEAP